MKEIKTKKIKSKKEKQFIIFDISFIVFCLVVEQLRTNVSIIGKYIEYIKLYNGNLMGIFNISIGYLWMLILGIIFNCFILIAIYLAFRIARMKVIKENSKYRVIDNIDYYRERFNNITPTEISLITDLEIETKKDIAASILNLYQKKIIDFVDNHIIVKDESSSLKQSEIKLLEMIKNNNFSPDNTQEWKNKCIEEAKTDNYIKIKVDKEKGPNFKKNGKVINVCIVLLILSILVGTLYMFSPKGQEWSKQLELFDKYDVVGMSDIEIVENNEDAKNIFTNIIANSGPMMLISFIMFASIFTLIGTPIYRKVRKRIYKKVEVENRFERTNEGEILVEQIVGIKNFIHDFSLLSEKEKESITLWEDFLIYAIVLEENEKIIKDIFNYKNVNLDIWKNIIKNVINFNNI